MIIREIGRRMSCGPQITETRQVMVEIGVEDTINGADTQGRIGGTWDLTVAVLNVALRITGIRIVRKGKR